MYLSIWSENWGKVYREEPSRILVRDAHFCMFDHNTGDFVTVPLQEGDSQQMKAMIVLEVPPEELIRRRETEQGARKDRVLDPNVVEKEMSLELIVARQQAQELSIPFLVVRNHGRTPEETCQEITRQLEKKSLLEKRED